MEMMLLLPLLLRDNKLNLLSAENPTASSRSLDSSRHAAPFCTSLKCGCMCLQIGKPVPPSPTKDRRNSMGSPMHKGPGSPLRRISRVERRYDQSRASLKIPAGSPMCQFFLCAFGAKPIQLMPLCQQEVTVPHHHVGITHLPVFCCSPSGEKKSLEQKSSGDMNGYQIRV